MYVIEVVGNEEVKVGVVVTMVVDSRDRLEWKSV